MIDLMNDGYPLYRLLTYQCMLQRIERKSSEYRQSPIQFQQFIGFILNINFYQ